LLKILLLNKVKEGKYKYPNQIDKVPVQSYFLYHFITFSMLVGTYNNIKEDNDVNQYSRENVKTVKTCNKEKEICK
jgi:hypothetical protein